MLFMNTMEIDEAIQRHAKHTVLYRASKLLADLRDLADSVSDGWCYWPKPARSARKLMELIRDNPSPTETDLLKAVSPIKAFLTRERQNLLGKTLDLPC